MLFVIAALLLVVLVVTAIVRAVQIIPQATAAVVERLGRFKAVEEPGLRVSSDVRVHRAILDVCPNTRLRQSTAEVLELSLDPMLL